MKTVFSTNPLLLQMTGMTMTSETRLTIKISPHQAINQHLPLNTRLSTAPPCSHTCNGSGSVRRVCLPGSALSYSSLWTTSSPGLSPHFLLISITDLLIALWWPSTRFCTDLGQKLPETENLGQTVSTYCNAVRYHWFYIFILGDITKDIWGLTSDKWSFAHGLICMSKVKNKLCSPLDS